MVSMRTLECLVTIVERGSLTNAAAVLHMSQPALSHQIAALERELGTPVIERLPRGHVVVLGQEEVVVVASPDHRFADPETVPPAELAGEAFVHYNPGNGFGVWADQFAARRGVVLPQPALRTGSPRTAAQLAAAGMGVAIVPFSAIGALPDATIRSLDPVELRDVIAIVAAPHDDLLRRFVGDLKRRGLPPARAPWLRQLTATPAVGEPA